MKRRSKTKKGKDLIVRKEKPEHEQVLGPLVTDKMDRISEYKRRKPRVFKKKVAQEEVEALLADGWIERRKLRDGKVSVEKQKPHDEIIENRFWSILYQLGFEELNQSRQFQIRVTSGGEAVDKQVDVFAKIGNVVIVAECKSCAKKQQRSLQKDIGEFASLKRPIANALRKHYGDNEKLKIVWLLVTNNIKWTNPDRARADEQNIQIVEERELRYFEEVARGIGPAAKFQFLGDFLRDQEIPELSNYTVPAIRTTLGGNRVYYFLAPASRILPIAFVNHRGLRDIEGAPAYQRVLKRDRLREIGNYLDRGGFFPNCILVNFRKEVRFEKKTSFEDRQITFGNLYLPDTFKSVWVIDGQHRLFGFTEMSKDMDSTPIPILAFEQLSTISEAELFTTINSKQQKVAKGLLDELAGELKFDSDVFSERVSAIAARALDMMANESGGPFEDRIKTADLSESDTICLTISQIKNAVVSARLLGSIASNGVEIPGPFTRTSKGDTLDALCEGLTAYFQLVQAANQERWDQGRSGHLCINIAVQGYIRLLQALIEFMADETRQEPHSLEADELIEQIKPYLEPVLDFVETAESDEFAKRFKPQFGSGGPPRYFYNLCALVKSKFPNFKPAGYDEFVSEHSQEVREQADALNRSVVDRVHTHVVTVLKNAYGSAFFDKGIPQKDIKLAAMNKMYEDKGDQMPPETYLDVIELKKIVEHSQNWELFKETLNIQLEDERKGQAKYLKWMERLNEVRRIPAHPFGRVYKEEDLNFLDYISEQLEARDV